MAAFIKKEGGKRFGASGGKPSFGGARSGKPSFGKKSWGDSRPSGPVTHHKATCTKCGESCEVPFKPVNGKPIFCRNCFVKTGDTGSGRAGDKYPKREYQPHGYTKPAPEGGNNKDMMKQLEVLNEKIERLIQAVGGSASEK